MLSHLSKQHFWYFNLFSQNCSTNLNSTTNPLHPHNASVYSDSTPASPNPLYTRSHSLLYISIFRIRSIPFPLFFHFNPLIQLALISLQYTMTSLFYTLSFFSVPLYSISALLPFLSKFFSHSHSTLFLTLLWLNTRHPDFPLLSLHSTLFYLIHYFHTNPTPLYFHSSYQLSSTTPLPHHSSWLPLHCTASYLYYDHSTNYITLSTIVSGYFCHFKNIAIPCRLNLSRLYIVNTFRILGNEARHFTLKDDTTANRNAATAPAVVPPTYTTIDGLSFVGK